jgi:hypothetical protein
VAAYAATKAAIHNMTVAVKPKTPPVRKYRSFRRSGLDIMLIRFLWSDLYVPAIDGKLVSTPRSGHLIVEAAFLAKHKVFRRLNPGAEIWPTAPNQKQSEHNG